MMKMNEVIEFLDYKIKFYEDVIKSYEKEFSTDKKAIKSYDTRLRYHKKLKEAVEKQIPKKVIKEMNEHNATDYLCPICKGTIHSYDNYCGKCGQKIY